MEMLFWRYNIGKLLKGFTNRMIEDWKSIKSQEGEFLQPSKVLYSCLMQFFSLGKLFRNPIPPNGKTGGLLQGGLAIDSGVSFVKLGFTGLM